MPGWHVDPPELAHYSARGDAPIEKWPGQPVTTEKIMQATGDPRDWYRYGHRLRAAEGVWRGWAINRKRREGTLYKDFPCNRVLIIGDCGSGKTTPGIHHARKAFRRGHPVFSNASASFAGTWSTSRCTRPWDSCQRTLSC